MGGRERQRQPWEERGSGGGNQLPWERRKESGDRQGTRPIKPWPSCGAECCNELVRSQATWVLLSDPYSICAAGIT